MPDITMCISSQKLPKCEKCYRKTATPDMFQSWADFYKDCKEKKYAYFMKEGSKC